MRKILNKGDVLFKEGDKPDRAYLVISGTLQTYSEQNGKKVILGQVPTGELIGEMSLIDKTNRIATAVALEKCALFVIDRIQLDDRISKSDPIVRALLQGFSRRYRGSLNILKGEQKLSTISDTSVFDVLATEKIQLEYQLKQAIEKKQLKVCFQPILDINSDEIVGYEALVRWEHPESGVIPPQKFISLAEETSLIHDVGDFVLEYVCEAFPKLRNADTQANPFISLNISPKQIVRKEFIEELIEKVNHSAIPANRFKIEITESAALSFDDIEHLITLCHKHDIKVALDNFGTGASNLALMHKLKFDSITIDRSFTRDMHNNAHSMALVNMIINLGLSIKTDVLVAGIENEGMLDRVRELNCRFAQGYHIGKPDSIEKLINKIEVKKMMAAENSDASVTQITRMLIVEDEDI